MRTLTIILLIFLTSSITSANTLTKKKEKYVKAKAELMYALKTSEPNFDPNTPRLLMEFNALGRTGDGEKLKKLGLNPNDAKELKDRKFVHKKCKIFFSIANTFSEPTLFNQCKKWGYLPKSPSSF